MADFETASAHVTGELRKVEVNLSQLPVTFDRLGADIKELEEALKKSARDGKAE